MLFSGEVTHWRECTMFSSCWRRQCLNNVIGPLNDWESALGNLCRVSILSRRGQTIDQDVAHGAEHAGHG